MSDAPRQVSQDEEAVREDPFAPGRHSPPIGEDLSRFLLEDWDDGTPCTLAPHAPLTSYRARRARLAARFAGEVVVVPSGIERARCGDQSYPFRPSSDYAYLTGDQQPDGVLVVDGRDGTALLFLLPAEKRTTTAFFQSAKRGELWIGPQPTLGEVEAELGIECRPLDELPKVLGDARSFRVLRGLDPAVDASVEPRAFEDAELAAVLSEHRLVKDDWAIEEMQRAVDATARAFDEVVAGLPRAVELGERYVEGVFGLWARVLGNGTGYSTIAAGGPHATTLHWSRNDGAVRRGELLLLDAGVETSSLYTADITRTVPVGGEFSPAQRRVYELVLEAQEAGFAAVRAGNSFRDFHSATDKVLSAGLASWGILPEPADRSVAQGLHRRYTVHAPGHMLGLDVHDCGKARAAAYPEGTLEVGNVLTVEPGLYFQEDDLTVPAELRGIGVRIEDDVVVTAGGCTVLSAGIPRAVEDVEAWVAGRSPRQFTADLG